MGDLRVRRPALEGIAAVACLPVRAFLPVLALKKSDIRRSLHKAVNSIAG